MNKILKYFFPIFFVLLLAFFVFPKYASASCKWTTHAKCSDMGIMGKWVQNNGACAGSGYNASTNKCCCEIGCCELFTNGTVSKVEDKTEADCQAMTSGGQYSKVSWHGNRLVSNGKCVLKSILKSLNTTGCCEYQVQIAGVFVGLYANNTYHCEYQKKINCTGAFYPNATCGSSDHRCHINPKSKSTSGSATTVLPTFTQLSNPLGTINIPRIIGRIVRAIILILGALALIMVIYGGLIWMTAAGNEQNITKGKNTLIWAILGLIIASAAYLLVKYIIEAIGAV